MVALPRIPCQQRVKGFSARQLKDRDGERDSKRGSETAASCSTGLGRTGTVHFPWAAEQGHISLSPKTQVFSCLPLAAPPWSCWGRETERPLETCVALGAAFGPGPLSEVPFRLHLPPASTVQTHPGVWSLVRTVGPDLLSLLRPTGLPWLVGSPEGSQLTP